LREEDEGGRAMVMTNECGQEAEQRSGFVLEISRLSSGESLTCVRENLIFDAFVDF